MMEDYYSPHAQLLLARSLVLVGHPASGVDQVGRMISGRTGVPFNDVERAAEAMAGASRGRVLLDDGIERMRELEGAALEKAVRRRPSGVIVMESGLFERPEWLTWLQERCDVLYVRRPDAVLLHLVREQVARVPGSLPEFMAGAPHDTASLRDYLAERESTLGGVELIVEAENRAPSWVASQIIGSLEHVFQAESLAR